MITDLHQEIRDVTNAFRREVPSGPDTEAALAKLSASHQCLSA